MTGERGRAPGDSSQRARRRRLARHPDPYIRAVTRLAEQGRDVCDCPCHWYRDVEERLPCCPNRGMQWVDSADEYAPWGEQ
jgi:hypothetical protein